MLRAYMVINVSDFVKCFFLFVSLSALLFEVGSSPVLAQGSEERVYVSDLATQAPSDPVEQARDIWTDENCCGSIQLRSQLRLESWVFAKLREAEANVQDPRRYRQAISEMLNIKGLRIGYFPGGGHQASEYRELIDEYFRYAAQIGRDGDAEGEALLYRQQIAYIRRWSEEVDADTEFEFLDKDDEIIATALVELAYNLQRRGNRDEAVVQRAEAQELRARINREKLGPLLETRAVQRETGLWSNAMFTSGSIYDIIRDLPESSEEEKVNALLELAFDEFNSPALRQIDLPPEGRGNNWFGRGGAFSFYQASQQMRVVEGENWPQSSLMTAFQERVAETGLPPVIASVDGYLVSGEVSVDAVRRAFDRPGIRALNEYNRTLFLERGKCAPYGSGEINACWLDAQLKILSVLDAAGVMSSHLGRRELEEMAGAQQLLGNTAESLALLQRLYGPGFERLDEEEQIDGFLFVFGQVLLDAGKYADLERITLRARALDPDAEAISNTDQRFLYSFNDWLDSVVTSARRRRNQLLMQAYLGQPDKAGLAFEEAMTLVEADRERRASYGLTPWVERSNERDFRASAIFRNAADAGWARARINSPDGQPLRTSQASDETSALIETVQGLLQDATLDPTGLALAYALSERAADVGDAETRSLIRRRHALNAAWHNSRGSDVLELGDVEALIARQMLQNSEADIATEMATITRKLEQSAPEYFAMIRPNAIETSELQTALREGEALLQIVPSNGGTHVLLILPNEVVWHRPSLGVEELSQPVQRLLWDLGVDIDVDSNTAKAWLDEGHGAYPYDRSTAFMLYRTLFAPLEDALSGTDTVYYAATGQIANLPLGAMVTAPPTGIDGNPADLRGTQWLADKFALAKVPSLQSWWFLRTYRSAGSSNSTFLGFGDPVLTGDASNRRSSRGSTKDPNQRQIASFYREGDVSSEDLSLLASLPGTAREIRALQSALGASDESVFLREKATESAFKSADLGNAAIIALATHGLLAGELFDGVEPGLVFTPTAGTNDNEGYLTASEIARLRLNAEWVILSACNTAGGDGSIGAPGLSGIARSFFFAGARSLLVSHWPVRDAVAEKLTVRAIEIARSNPEINRARALSLAMKEIRDDASADTENDTWAHPNAWAPFSLVGDAPTD